MKSFKVQMNVTEAWIILQSLLGKGVSDVTPINMGELSRVFRFTWNSNNYVVHFKQDRISFDKAKFMYETYGSPCLPIPRVVEIGEVDGIYYCISEKASGKPIQSFIGDGRMDKILDDLARIFTYTSQISIDPRKGFGYISPFSPSPGLESWADTLRFHFDENVEGFHKNWTDLYQTSFLEPSLFEKGYEKMMKLASFSPETPHLVHGDFHLGNMLSDGEKVTGIVDWEMVQYGDFMLDIAGLHFWSPELNFPERVRKLWLENGVDIPYFEERLRCHLLLKGIDGLRFYAKQNAKESYDYMKKRVLELLEE